MKKLILGSLMTFGITFGAMSQVNPHAIGLRAGGGSYGNGVEVSYQHGMGDANRLELDLGLRTGSSYQHFIVSGIYHWAWNITSGLNWYVGPGAQLGSYKYKYSNGNDGGLTLSIGGQVGIEFDFNEMGFPILLSLDTRPMWDLLGNGYGNGYGAALAVRYTF